ncbi:hypothetical protein ACFQZ4_09240 [Catellatospora coxensis]
MSYTTYSCSTDAISQEASRSAATSRSSRSRAEVRPTPRQRWVRKRSCRPSSRTRRALRDSRASCCSASVATATRDATSPAGSTSFTWCSK